MSRLEFREGGPGVYTVFMYRDDGKKRFQFIVQGTEAGEEVAVLDEPYVFSSIVNANNPGHAAQRAYESWAEQRPAAPVTGEVWGLRDGLCCRCGRRTNEADGSLIQWVCSQCHKTVCMGCALTIPNSSPRQLYTDTLCSTECWERAGRPEE